MLNQDRGPWAVMSGVGVKEEEAEDEGDGKEAWLMKGLGVAEMAPESLH